MLSDKEFLLKDLYARIPYHPKAEITFGNTKKIETLKSTHLYSPTYSSHKPKKYEVKLFLRPMSSMTEEERQIEINYKRDITTQGLGVVELYMNQYIEWLDSNHFDWRTDGNNKTLIERGLALVAPKGMYKFG